MTPTTPIASMTPSTAADKAPAHIKPHTGPVTLFTELGLIKPLMDAVKGEGYTTPTPIQAAAIPAALQGKDILGCAQTGTGKTAAFALPIIQRLMTAATDKNQRGPVYPRALILSPTRELATQIAESFATYGKHTVLRHTTVFGGVSQFHQVRALKQGVDVLVATPGRLMDLMNQRLVNLSQVSIFVLDEADRMLDMGFIDPIRRIASALPAREAVNRQTLLFSATMPREIMHLADSLLHHPVKISVTPVSSAAPLIEQSLYVVPKERKALLLEHLLEEGNIQRAVVFTRTKFGAERLGNRLCAAGITAESIHGDKAQNARKKALSRFKEGLSRVLVATDVAARGLDVDGITHVFNFDLPYEPEAYIHRIGRTGRAGAKGLAVAFCDPSEHGLLRQIERLTKTRINQVAKLPDLKQRIHADMDRNDTRPPAPGMPRQQRFNDGPRPSSGHRERPAYLGHAPQKPMHDQAPTSDRPQRTRREDVPGTLVEHKGQTAHSSPHAPAHPHASHAHHTPRREAAPAVSNHGGAAKPQQGFGQRSGGGPKRTGGKPGWGNTGRGGGKGGNRFGGSRGGR